MKKIICLSGLVLFVLLASVFLNNNPSKAATPVEKWGQLRVSGTNIVSEREESAVKGSEYTWNRMVSAICQFLLLSEFP